jgi:hypothetical protein
MGHKSFCRWLVFGPLLFMGFKASGQTNSRPGEVTYITGENVYVRFPSTDGLAAGDTLRGEDGSPCLVVQQMSSTSCVTVPIGGCTPAVGHAMLATIAAPPETPEVAESKEAAADPNPGEAPSQNASAGTSTPPMRISGSVTAAAFATSALRNSHAGLTTARGTFRVNLGAENLAGLPLDVDLAGNFQSIYRDANASTPGWRQRNTFYQVAATYRLNKPGIAITAGRRLARGFSTVGSLDGLHAEWRQGPWVAGAMAGFQPGLLTNGFDTNRPAYGLHVGRHGRGDVLRTDWRLGFLAQSFAGATDRQFVFGQYDLDLGNTLQLFASGEWDVYATAGYERSGPRALFGSVQWQFAPGWSAYLSGDKRAPIMRFSSFESATLQSLMDRPAQTVYRTRLSGRIAANHRFTLGLSDRRETASIGRTAQLRYTWSDLPRVGGRLGYSAFNTRMPMMTNLSQRVSYDAELGREDVRMEIHYRWVRTSFERENMETVNQHYWGGGVYGRFGEHWRASLSVESATQKFQNLLRLQASLTYRFSYTNDESNPN